jgi:pyrimidine deaminase RibD-like protein
MLLSDFRIKNLDKLDRILVDLCSEIVRAKLDHTDLGMVAAAVLDPNDNCVSAINYPAEDGSRVHAERAAMDAYLEQFGDIPPGSIIITTLSPCTEDMPDRHGESCTDLINQFGVHKVYAGYADPSQDEVRKKFHVKTTTNPRIRQLCKAFADTFLKDDLNELEFLGSPCTRDCSGHRAGYAWSQSKGGQVAQSPFSPSFNTGSQLHVDGK